MPLANTSTGIIVAVAAAALVIVFAAIYGLYKARERRKARPVRGVINGKLMGEPQFFRLYKEP